jgi:cardiolipin synthase
VRNVKVLTDGREAFDCIVGQIDSAKHSIVVNMFIWRDDPLGNRLGRALLAAADRGLDVVILKDRLGALFELGEEGRQSFFHKKIDLRTAVRLRAINGFSARPDVLSRVVQKPNELVGKLRAHSNITIFDEVERSDHSKYILVDDDILLFGGLNIEQRAVATDASGLVWRDYLFECVGREYVSKLRDRLAGDPRGQSSFEFVLNDVGGNGRFEIKPCVLNLLDSASISCHIEMAYVGDPAVTEKLVQAANRGVDVHIVIPAWANIQNERNLKTMCELFNRSEGRASIYLSPDMVHSKMMDIDGRAIFVGSANFNKRALNEYAELNVLISGEPACARTIRDSFERRRRTSRKVKSETDLRYRKVKQWCEYVFG